MSSQAEHQTEKKAGPKRNAKTELYQTVLHCYGFGCSFDRTDDGFWFASIHVKIGSPPLKALSSCQAANEKEGIAAASQAALDILQPIVDPDWSCRPLKELSSVFPDHIPIRDSSNPRCWPSFWKRKPLVVGIDVEGNHTNPPVLVQIAVQYSDEIYCILETPQIHGLSDNLQRLLRDSSIIKVFCDNYAHNDKKCLGIPAEDDWSDGSIVDLESIMNRHLGPSTVARGLGRIVSHAMPELGVMIGKPKESNNKLKSRMQRIGRFALIEQGKKPPLEAVSELNYREKQYAALDALVTLRAYLRLEETKL